MAEFVAWVVARADDTSLSPLSALGAEVTLVTGEDASAFEGAPRPDAIMFATGSRPLFERVWSIAGGAPWVHSRFAGVDHVLFPALVASQSTLTNGRGAFAPALAEFAMGALLFFAKDFRRMLAGQREGRWDPFQPSELRGQTLGIVGYGAIGRAVADLAHGFGMKLLATRQHPERSANDPWVGVDQTLPADRTVDLCAASDHVVVAAPLTPFTHKLVGARAIAAMRSHGVLVNVGRGPVVDEAALIAALDRGALLGAALDVFEQEPLRQGHPFYASERVLLSPHCADRVPGWLERATDVFVDNVRRRLRGEPLANVVDMTLGY